MKMLIITQAVDKNHPVLGFFHRWIEGFAKHVEHVHVIALQTGEYNLPKNVTVHSLGKENGKGKIQIIFNYYSLPFKLRREYGAVFVHMNPEYIVLAGWWWRLNGKKVALWYTHKSVNLKLRIAEFFTNIIFTASKESFRFPSKKLQVMGHGIDTDFFKPDENIVRGNHALSVGRLMKTKRHDLAIQKAKEASLPLRIVGEGSERERLMERVKELNAEVTFLGALTQEQLRHEYQTAHMLIHTSETGSLDKVVLEAAACGLPVDSSDPAISALPLSPSYVREHHSLEKLIPRIINTYEAPSF